MFHFIILWRLLINTTKAQCTGAIFQHADQNWDSYIPLTAYSPIGCYRDSSTRRLRLYLGNSIAVSTPVNCNAACSLRNFELFAVQNYNECRCDNDLTYAKSLGPGSCGLTGAAWLNYI